MRSHQFATRVHYGAGALRCHPAPGPGVYDAALQDEVETNLFTIDAVDPKSGTAEFKAAAIRIDKLDTVDEVG